MNNLDRLQKVIAASGLCSRRKAEILITEGKVTVNGEVITTLGTQVRPKDHILVNGESLKKPPSLYYVFFKPEGCVSTTLDPYKRKTVLDYIDTQEKLFPVGRLDYDTSGILLLTNDGTFANSMLSPKYAIEKEYEVTLEGFLRKETSKKISAGVYLDKVKTKRARITKVSYLKDKSKTTLNIIITEGKYHHIKRLFETFGHNVLKLKRIRFGVLTLKDLRKGEYRLLKPHEMKQLTLLARENIQKSETLS